MGRPTRNDVANYARVSGATVSRVLSGRNDLAVTDETRARVLAAASQLGYRPNPTARALVTGHSQIIGLWMCLDYSRYRSQVVARLQALLRKSDYCMAISDIEEELGRHHSFSRAARVPADGVIAFDTPTAGAEVTRADAPHNRSFVSMGAYWNPLTHFVGVDLHSGAVEAVRHLVETGRRHIAFVALRESGEGTARSRYTGYRDVLADAGLPSRFVDTDCSSIQSGMQAVASLLQAAPETDAVFCLNDDLAIGAYRAVTESGRRVGGEVAIVGCDGIEETEMLACPITTIEQPIDAMCELAWQFLQTSIEDPSTPLQQIVLTPRLLVRASSAGGGMSQKGW